MNLVSIDANQNIVTTSLAIADGVGNSHKTVMQLIRQNLSDLNEFGNTAFEMRNSKSGGGRPTEYALLNEQQSTLLLTYMRNNEIVKKFKLRLVKAFFEMRDQLQGQKPDMSNMSRLDILKLAIEAEENNLRLAHVNHELAEQKEALEEHKGELEKTLEAAAPKVAFANQVELSQDAITVAQAAKVLGTGQRRLYDQLRRLGWVTRNNDPYQAKIEAGYLNVKISRWSHPQYGLQQSVTPLITGKGLVKLQKLLCQQDIFDGDAA